MQPSKNVFIKKKKFKYKQHLIYASLTVILLSVLAVALVPSINEKALAIWKGFLTVLMSFILINGKFVLKAFLKKIFILSAIGLGKRFFIEKIIMENLITLYVKKLPLALFLKKAKEGFFNFSLVKKIVAFVGVILSTIGGIVAFGDIMLLKVIIAKFWSFMLALFAKLMWFLGYILLDSGWIRMLIEVVILGWLMVLLEKVPFIHRLVISFYSLFESSVKKTAHILEKTFNLPAQKAINKLTIHTSKWMHKFIGSEGYETYHQFIVRHREEKPSIHKQLYLYRSSRKHYTAKLNEKRISTYTKQKMSRNVSKREQLLLSRKTVFDVSENRLYVHKEHKL